MSWASGRSSWTAERRRAWPARLWLPQPAEQTWVWPASPPPHRAYGDTTSEPSAAPQLPTAWRRQPESGRPPARAQTVPLALVTDAEAESGRNRETFLTLTELLSELLPLAWMGTFPRCRMAARILKISICWSGCTPARYTNIPDWFQNYQRSHLYITQWRPRMLLKVLKCLCVCIVSTQNGEGIAGALQVCRVIGASNLHLSSLVSVAEVLRCVWKKEGQQLY